MVHTGVCGQAKSGAALCRPPGRSRKRAGDGDTDAHHRNAALTVDAGNACPGARSRQRRPIGCPASASPTSWPISKLVRMCGCRHESAPTCRGSRQRAARATGSAGRRGWRVRARHQQDVADMRGDAGSAREASAGYPQAGVNGLEPAPHADDCHAQYGLEPAPHADGCPAQYGLEPAPHADGCHAQYGLGSRAAR